MSRKLFFIKAIHTIIFFFQLACIIYLLYAGIARIYHWTVLVATAAIVINGIALLLNRWRCPLTTFAERQGAEKGGVTDLFLPATIADNVFRIALVLFPAELILLGVGYLLK
jgi:hypothetical protein